LSIPVIHLLLALIRAARAATACRRTHGEALQADRHAADIGPTARPAGGDRRPAAFRPRNRRNVE